MECGEREVINIIYGITSLTGPDADAYGQALYVAHMYQMELDSEAINAVNECSGCGKPMPDGVGVVSSWKVNRSLSVPMVAATRATRNTGWG